MSRKRYFYNLKREALVSCKKREPKEKTTDGYIHHRKYVFPISWKERKPQNVENMSNRLYEFTINNFLISTIIVITFIEKECVTFLPNINLL